MPKGRRKHCSDACARKAWKTAEHGREAAIPEGTERSNRVFVPGHPLAVKSGWVLAHRLAAYEERAGRCVCQAVGGSGLDWEDAKVVPFRDRWLVLCPDHNRVHSFATLLVSGTFTGVDVRELLNGLNPLWAAPCPGRVAVGVPEAPGDARVREIPRRGDPPDSVPPLTTVSRGKDQGGEGGAMDGVQSGRFEVADR